MGEKAIGFLGNDCFQYSACHYHAGNFFFTMSIDINNTRVSVQTFRSTFDFMSSKRPQMLSILICSN